MNNAERAHVAIVDFGLGNLYSVKRTCEYVGLRATITSQPEEIKRADGILLPGVGAFGDAMAALKRHDLISVLRDAAAENRPFMGICLGVQLLMTESQEFGTHQGLDIIKGSVVRLQDPEEGGRRLKVPHVGWNRISAPAGRAGCWKDSPLQDVASGEFMYFVHSYCVQPADPSVVLSVTRYGQIEFCSSVLRGNIFACQFHPERSGERGVQIYRTFAEMLTGKNERIANGK
jgi:glutamine amidotransferase